MLFFECISMNLQIDFLKSSELCMLASFLSDHHIRPIRKCDLVIHKNFTLTKLALTIARGRNLILKWGTEYLLYR